MAGQQVHGAKKSRLQKATAVATNGGTAARGPRTGCSGSSEMLLGVVGPAAWGRWTSMVDVVEHCLEGLVAEREQPRLELVQAYSQCPPIHWRTMWLS